jgi:hypothetical protein
VKKLIVIALLLAMASPAIAVNPKCKSLGQLGYSIMLNRQIGAQKQRLEKQLDAEDLALTERNKELFKAMIDKAYEYPMGKTDDDKGFYVTDFSTQVYDACVKAESF